jgi:hypothetical protein
LDVQSLSDLASLTRLAIALVMMPISIMNEVGGKENYDPKTAAFFLWSVSHEGRHLCPLGVLRDLRPQSTNVS